MLKLGSTDINKSYLGSTEINKIYLGADEVFSGGVEPAAPENTVAPTISGDPYVGSTLTINNGTWTSADSFAYQATRDGSDIVGETDQTYVVTTTDVGTDIGGEVTATNETGSTGPVSTSNVIEIFDPLATANSVFILDASDPSYYTAASGVVYQINDPSPAGNDVTAPNPPTNLDAIYGVQVGVRTLNGRPTYSFDPISITGAHIDLASALNALPNGGGDFTWIITFAARDLVNEQRIMAGNISGGSRHVIVFEPANNRIGFQNKSSYAPGYITISPDNDVHTVWMRRVGAVLTYGYDALTGTQAAANTGTIVNIEIGRNPTNAQMFTGDIPFAGLWDRALSDVEIAALI